MKYLYIYSKFVEEWLVENVNSPTVPFIDLPTIQLSNHTPARIGVIDLTTNKEYVSPIIIGRVVLKDIECYKYKPSTSNKYGYFKACIQFVWGTLQEIQFEEIKAINTDFFLNKIVPFINWGFNKNKDIRIILMFSILLCKREVVKEGDSYVLSRPYISISFLENMNVIRKFKYSFRTGREDWANEYASFSFVPRSIVEYYYIKLLAEELTDPHYNAAPSILEEKQDDTINITCCTMSDDNAYYSQYAGRPEQYSKKECYEYKKLLIDKHEEFYSMLFEKFLTLFEEFNISKETF